MQPKTCNCSKHKRCGLCNYCKVLKWRKEHPIEYAYQKLRGNAKRRGKEFTITLEDFKKFCYETEYIMRKGRTKISYSIDRIDDNKGYVPGNLQPLTVSENSKKERRRKYLDYDAITGIAKVITLPTFSTTADGLPF